MSTGPGTAPGISDVLGAEVGEGGEVGVEGTALAAPAARRKERRSHNQQIAAAAAHAVASTCHRKQQVLVIRNPSRAVTDLRKGMTSTSTVAEVEAIFAGVACACIRRFGRVTGRRHAVVTQSLSTAQAAGVPAGDPHSW